MATKIHAPMMDESGHEQLSLDIVPGLDPTEIQEPTEKRRNVTSWKNEVDPFCESNKTSTSFYNLTDDIIFGIDLEWNITSLNPAAERIFGYSIEKVIGGSILKFVRSDFVPVITNLLDTKLRDLDINAESIEVIVFSKDGQERWLDVIATVLTSPDGAPSSIQGIARDITDRKQAERDLLLSEQKYRSIFENTNAAMGIIEENDILSLVNGEFEKLTGYAREYVENVRTWMSFVDPRDVDRMMTYHTARMSGGKAPRNYEFNLICKSGETRHVYITVAFIGDSRKRVVSMTDLTERDTAGASLAKSEARYRAFMNATSDAAFMKDENFRYVLVNNAFLEKSGNRKEFDVLGKRASDILPPELAELERKSDELALTAGTFVVVEERVRDRIFEIRKFPVPLENGAMGIGAIVRNVTDVRLAEEEKRSLEIELQRARKMEALGTLAGGIAHDLNNVLGGMVSLPELLMMQFSDDNPIRKQLALIKRSGEKTARIVEDMLTLTRRGVTDPEVVNLNDIIAAHFESPEHDKLVFHHPRVRFTVQLNDQLLNIMGSPVHISKAVMNLLSNAAEAMPQGGTVVIKTDNRYLDKPIQGYDDIREGDYVVFTIQDTGIGIPPDDIEKIFEPFFTKKIMGRSGTGLGMTVVWGTVNDHNGYIDVKSGEGTGTTFRLYFPATRKTVKRKREPFPIEKYMGTGETILVVDDIPEQLELASSILSRLGYKTVTALSGEEALDYLRKHSVDLVILDMVMAPGIDGVETYKRILQIHPAQKAIITSGYDENARIQQARKLGVGAFIKKPYFIEGIGTAIRKELDG